MVWLSDRVWLALRNPNVPPNTPKNIQTEEAKAPILQSCSTLSETRWSCFVPEAGKKNLRVSFDGGTGKELDPIFLHRRGGEMKDQGGVVGPGRHLEAETGGLRV